MYSNLVNVVNTAYWQFINSVSQAKLTGIMLGLFLQKSNFSKNHAITIVGYSLGGVAAMHAMRMLHTNYCKTGDPKPASILNDVHIWAGAYVINMTKEYSEIKERSQVCSVTNGNLNNLYSEKEGKIVVARCSWGKCADIWRDPHSAHCVHPMEAGSGPS